MHPIIRIGQLLRRVEKVETRKKFQKIVHILQVMGAPFPESFKFSHFGAYSADLRAELDAFANEELVAETSENRGQYQSYTLRPTQQLLELLDSVPDLEEPQWVQWAVELNTQKPQHLEGVSTVLYLYQRRWPKTAWETQFRQAKPYLADGFAEYEREAVTLLEKCGKAAA